MDRIAEAPCTQAEKKEDPIAVTAEAESSTNPATATASGDGDVAMDTAAAEPSGSKDASSSSAAAASTADKSKTKKRQGVVLAAEKKVTSKLLDKAGGGPDEKVFAINECVGNLGVSSAFISRADMIPLLNVHSLCAYNCSDAILFR